MIANIVTGFMFVAWVLIVYFVPVPKSIECREGLVPLAKYHVLGIPVQWICVVGEHPIQK